MIGKISSKEVIPGASTRTQKVLKPGCLWGLGKARIPKPLDEAGEDHLALGPHKIRFSIPPSVPSSGNLFNPPLYRRSSPDLHIWTPRPA